jgi:hypothetical protein
MLSNRLLLTAIAFFVLGVAAGMYMGIAQDFRFVHVHAHINLLGWVALGLAGLLYAVHPRLQTTWMAHAHYWLHTVGLIVFMGGFAWGSASGDKPFVPIAIGATSVTLGVVLFAVNAFIRLRSGSAAQPAA